MSRIIAAFYTAVALCLLLIGPAAAPLRAQDWQSATTLPGVDFSGLSAPQKASVLRVMRSQGCSCGCDMRLAECRTKDPTCSYSRGMAQVIIDSIKAGKTEQEAFDAAKASRWGHVDQPKLLDDAVPININGSPVTGPADAKITIVEFSDFQCPYCILAVPQIQALLKAYPTQVRLVFKEFPLEIHSRAFLAAAAALAAYKQDKFWQMHDAMFDQRGALSRASFLKIAQSLSLDIPRFEKDMDSAETKKAIEKDLDDGERAGVEGTPTIFINGQRYNGAIQLNYLKPILDADLKGTGKTQTAALR